MVLGVWRKLFSRKKQTKKRQKNCNFSRHLRLSFVGTFPTIKMWFLFRVCEFLLKKSQTQEAHRLEFVFTEENYFLDILCFWNNFVPLWLNVIRRCLRFWIITKMKIQWRDHLDDNVMVLGILLRYKQTIDKST